MLVNKNSYSSNFSFEKVVEMGYDPDKCAWRTNPQRTKKPWGEEIGWSSLSTVRGKLISIDNGHRTSLKFHTQKNEAFYVVSGKVKFYFADEIWLHHKNVPMKCEILEAGDSVSVQSHCVYRIHAVEDSQIVEIADGHRDGFVRIEDDYNRETSQATYPNKFKE